MTTSRAQALEFLRAHQPMPSPTTDDTLIAQYLEAAQALAESRDDAEATTLLLGSISRGLGFFETVLRWVAERPPHIAAHAIRACLSQTNDLNKYWACRAAGELDASPTDLFEPLCEALEWTDADVRIAAATALETYGDRARPILVAHLARESDDDTSQLIAEMIANLGE
jgi:hypothetical protein